MSKVAATTDTITGLYLERTGGIVPVEDHNVPAHLIARIVQMLGLLTPNGIAARNPAACQFNSSTKRITAPASADPLVAIVEGLPVWMDDSVEETGTASSGTVTSLIDASLETADNNYWVTAWVVWLTGANAGLARQVSVFTNSTHQLEWVTPLPLAPSNGDTYVVTFCYVSGLTDDATNYIYLVRGTKTARNGLAYFSANTTGVAPSGGLLVATAVLDSGGTCTSVNNAPTGAARNLYPLMGRYDDTVQSVVTLDSIEAGAYADYYATHSQMAARGGLETSVDDANCTVTVLETHEDDRVKLRVTNSSGSYAATPTVTATIKGIRLMTLDS